MAVADISVWILGTLIVGMGNLPLMARACELVFRVESFWDMFQHHSDKLIPDKIWSSLLSLIVKTAAMLTKHQELSGSSYLCLDSYVS